MISFIWRNWWRHKERFILILIGALVLSSGLSYLVGLSETNRGTVVDTLQKSWKSSYDIVVRPPNTKSSTEEVGLVEPNYLSGISGGISLEQYNKIQRIKDVEVAAPISMIGYTSLDVNFRNVDDKVKKPDINDFGIYRLSYLEETDIGYGKENFSWKGYYTRGWFDVGEYTSPENTRIYGVRGQDYLTAIYTILLVGIDPEQEAKLVGLDQAILPINRSRYFTNKDKSTFFVENIEGTNRRNVSLPILISNEPFVDKIFTYKIEKLNLPFNKLNIARETMESIKKEGGKSYLDKVPTGEPRVYAYDTEQAYRILVRGLTGIDPETGASIEELEGNIKSYSSITHKVSPLIFSSTISPFLGRWPYAYRIEVQNSNSMWSKELKNSFRDDPTYSENSREWPFIRFNWIGFYDPEKLNIAKDPLTELPMETYRPPTAQLVLDAEGNPINPPTTIKPSGNPLGLLTSPPTMLTTIEAAEMIMGEKPISAIRIKVNGVDVINNENQKKLERVAKEIEEKKGLVADITFGSSPQPTLVYVPETKDSPALGWIEQPWIKMGTSITIFNETRLGFSGIIASVLLVAIVYVTATNIVSLLARRKELAVLLAVGWRPSQLVQMIFTESLIIGLFVAITSWGMAGYAFLQNNASFSLIRFILIGVLGLFIYLFGAIWPAILANKISPYEAIKMGEIKKTSKRFLQMRGLLPMAVGHMLGKLTRSLFSISSIAVPTTLLTFFIFVTFRLKGILYTTWLGQYITVEIEATHYIAMGIALIISIITTAEILWQNIVERKPEIALLKAIGYRGNSIRLMVLFEGLLIGLLAGILGIFIGNALIFGMYRQLPSMQEVGLILSVGLIPLVTGLLGAILPAEIAVRVRPSQGMRGQYSVKRRTARGLGIVVGLISLVIVISTATVVIKVLPYATVATSVDVDDKKNLEEEPIVDVNPTNELKIGDLSSFEPRSGSYGSRGDYDLSIEMNHTGEIISTAKITVQNNSNKQWDKLIFYFIPNAFTEESKTRLGKYAPTEFSEVKINSVQLNSSEINYTLDYDTLTLPITGNLEPEKSAVVNIEYQFTLPQPASRFTQIGDNYYLAQWYPVLANYMDGWEKEDYLVNGRSYHLGYSNFNLKYKIPEGYTLVTSSPSDPINMEIAGQLQLENEKELFVGVIKGMVSSSMEVNGVEVRVFTKTENQQLVDKVLTTATEALNYFEEKLGPYPGEQLDILLDGSATISYPSVITLVPSNDWESLQFSEIREIANQWFYRLVANNPYYDGWLNEGLSVLAASLYLHDHEKLPQEKSFLFAVKFYQFGEGENKVSNLSLKEYQEGGDLLSFVYGQPALKIWEGLSEHGSDEIFEFLREYIHLYLYKQIDSNEFVRFAKEYFKLSDDSLFESWLQISKK